MVRLVVFVVGDSCSYVDYCSHLLPSSRMDLSFALKAFCLTENPPSSPWWCSLQSVRPTHGPHRDPHPICLWSHRPIDGPCGLSTQKADPQSVSQPNEIPQASVRTDLPLASQLQGQTRTSAVAWLPLFRKTLQKSLQKRNLREKAVWDSSPTKHYWIFYRDIRWGTMCYNACNILRANSPYICVHH